MNISSSGKAFSRSQFPRTFSILLMPHVNREVHYLHNEPQYLFQDKTFNLFDDMAVTMCIAHNKHFHGYHLLFDKIR